MGSDSTSIILRIPWLFTAIRALVNGIRGRIDFTDISGNIVLSLSGNSEKFT